MEENRGYNFSDSVVYGCGNFTVQGDSNSRATMKVSLIISDKQ